MIHIRMAIPAGPVMAVALDSMFDDAIANGSSVLQASDEMGAVTFSKIASGNWLVIAGSSHYIVSAAGIGSKYGPTNNLTSLPSQVAPPWTVGYAGVLELFACERCLAFRSTCNSGRYTAIMMSMVEDPRISSLNVEKFARVTFSGGTVEFSNTAFYPFSGSNSIGTTTANRVIVPYSLEANPVFFDPLTGTPAKLGDIVRFTNAYGFTASQEGLLFVTSGFTASDGDSISDGAGRVWDYLMPIYIGPSPNAGHALWLRR